MHPDTLPLFFRAAVLYNHGYGQMVLMTRNYMQLPGVAQEIADVIGRERALYLIGQLPRAYSGSKAGPKSGGREGTTDKRSMQVIMYVPKVQRMRADHQLVRILGWHDAVKLCNAFGGEIMKPPTCAEIYRRFRDVSIVRLAGSMSRAELQEVFGVTDRHLRNVLKEIPPEARGVLVPDNSASKIQAVAA